MPLHSPRGRRLTPGGRLQYINEGQIWTSTDGGASWTKTEAPPTTPGLCIASSADGSRLVAAMAYSSTYTSTNGGTNWTQCVIPTSISEVVSSADGMRLAAVGDDGGIWASTDGGVVWTQTSAPVSSRPIIIGPASLRPADGQRLVAGAIQSRRRFGLQRTAAPPGPPTSAPARENGSPWLRPPMVLQATGGGDRRTPRWKQHGQHLHLHQWRGDVDGNQRAQRRLDFPRLLGRRIAVGRFSRWQRRLDLGRRHGPVPDGDDVSLPDGGH